MSSTYAQITRSGSGWAVTYYRQEGYCGGYQYRVPVGQCWCASLSEAQRRAAEAEGR